MIVAIVGMTGSGKTELAKQFLERKWQIIRFGDITEEILKERGLDLTEENERNIRESLRKEHGMHAYAKLNMAKLNKAVNSKDVAIDGLYSWEEYTHLKEKFGDQLLLLAVYAPPEMRYERLVEREIRPLTIEQSKKRDFKEIENLKKGAPIAMADYTILNVGTLFDLEENFDKFMMWLDETN